MDGGVRGKRIDLNPEHWDLIELPQHFDLHVLHHFYATEGQRYSWFDLIRSQIFNLGSDEEGAAFCSEWCARALGLPCATIFSPRTLGELVSGLLVPPWNMTKA